MSNAEFLINSRPLVELADGEDPVITPNDILIGTHGETDYPKGTAQMDFLTIRNEGIQRFWKSFTSDYLPSIAARAKWRKKTHNLAVGDIVFLCEGDYRYGWKKGLIVEIRVDEESRQVRQVAVRTGDGTVYRRSATNVAPIVRGCEPSAKGSVV